MGQQTRSLVLTPNSCEKDGLQYVRCQLGYFDGTIAEEDAYSLCKIMSHLVSSGDQICLSLYPIDEARWSDLTKQDWATLAEKRFVRKGLFRASKQVLWTVGHAQTIEKLRAIYQFAWNISGNEDLLALSIHGNSLPQIVETYQDDIGTSQKNEEELIKCCPFIMSRGHDGHWIYIYSSRNTAEDILGVVRGASNMPVHLSDKPL